MTLLETPVCDFGRKAHDFNLVNINGKTMNLDDCRGENGLLIMFISNHCPYVKAIQTQLVKDTRLLREYGINSVAIMPNDTESYPEDSFENMQRVAKEFNYPFPYLIDETQDVARTYGAICTPDYFGYNHKHELQYRGRLNATSPSNPSSDQDEPELLNAMIQIAKTGKGPGKQIPSMGCSIKWRDSI